MGASALSACAWRTLTTFPSSASRGHLLSPVGPPAWDEPHADETDRSRPTLLRHPAKAAGIPWTRVPSTVLDPVASKDCSFALTGVGLSLTPPTRYPHGWGQVLWMGIASVAAGTSPAVTCHATSREQVAFVTR